MSHKAFVEEAVLAAVEGAFSLADLNGAGGSLKKLGVTSVQYMKLFDFIETKLGIVIEIDVDPEAFESVEGISGYLNALTAPAA